MMIIKNLSYYKNRYRNAKTLKTKEKILNGSMNLFYEDQQKFISWQVQFENGNQK